MGAATKAVGRLMDSNLLEGNEGEKRLEGKEVGRGGEGKVCRRLLFAGSSRPPARKCGESEARTLRADNFGGSLTHRLHPGHQTAPRLGAIETFGGGRE